MACCKITLTGKVTPLFAFVIFVLLVSEVRAFVKVSLNLLVELLRHVIVLSILYISQRTAVKYNRASRILLRALGHHAYFIVATPDIATIGESYASQFTESMSIVTSLQDKALGSYFNLYQRHAAEKANSQIDLV